MAKRNVITIPATLTQHSHIPINSTKKRRVAAYARVSTDNEDQQTSYEAQVDYYTSYIKSREDWEFVGIYADEGISGCNTKKRAQFKQMVDDALAGKIDLILTKSVSRFARNTVDSLETIRKLKDKHVECYFEKENIWTFDGKGELLITIMSSLAQEESRSISENCTWGQRKRFADGKVTVPFKRFLGYDKGEDGNLVVNKEQAEVVKRIYSMFLQGKTPFGIAAILTEEGIPSPGGKEKWNASAVRSILSNEKYKGDALLQKSYTVNFLTKEKKVNEGEIPQYYVEGNHEAIIEPEVFEAVQRELARRVGGQNRHSGVRIFSGKIYCGDCGGLYGSKVWHSNSKYRKVIWQCNHKFTDGKRCGTPHFYDADIEGFFLQAVNKLLEDREQIIADLEEVVDTAFDTTALEGERERLNKELNEMTETMQQYIYENAHRAIDQAEYTSNFEAMNKRYEDAKTALAGVEAEISQKLMRKGNLVDYLKTLKRQESLIEEFDPMLWAALVDKMTVYSADDVRVLFKDGTEIRV